MTEEQISAFEHITKDTGDVAVVQGYAGAGKSYMLGAAREAWKGDGYQVKGGALAGKAAEGLEVSSGIESRTLHAWEYQWKEGRERLGPSDVFVIDEAGMVGSRQMQRVMAHAESAGAKVVLVGDTEQLQPIEAGAPFRAVAERSGQVVMSDIRRQHLDWQKQATKDLATQKTDNALEAYESRGFVHGHESKAEAMDAMVKAWDAHRQEQPKQTQIMLAFRRADVRELNERARGLRQAAGELGPDQRLTVRSRKGDGEEITKKSFAEGDRVYFLKNDRQMGVKNGSLGTIEGLEGSRLKVRLDAEGSRQGPVVAFDTRDYSHLDHGYAATVHKAQGVTVDRAHALAGDLYDRNVTYVAMSRHRDQVDVHWSKEEFGDREKLATTLGRARPRPMALDAHQAGREARQTAEAIKRRPRQQERGHGRADTQGDLEAGVGGSGRDPARGDHQVDRDGQRRDPADPQGRTGGLQGPDQPDPDRGAGRGDRAGGRGPGAEGQKDPGADREAAEQSKGQPREPDGVGVRAASLEAGGVSGQEGGREGRAEEQGREAQGVEADVDRGGVRDAGRDGAGDSSVRVVDQAEPGRQPDVPDRSGHAGGVRADGASATRLPVGVDDARRAEQREKDQSIEAQPGVSEPPVAGRSGASREEGKAGKREAARSEKEAQGKGQTLAERLRSKVDQMDKRKERKAKQRQQERAKDREKEKDREQKASRPTLKERLQAKREAQEARQKARTQERARARAEGKQPTLDRVRSLALLAEHERWTKSKGQGKRPSLRGADLAGEDLSGKDLRHADLRGAKLQGANLRECDLRKADLSGADLREAKMHFTDLRGADLSGAQLAGSKRLVCKLEGAKTKGTELEREQEKDRGKGFGLER